MKQLRHNFGHAQSLTDKHMYIHVRCLSTQRQTDRQTERQAGRQTDRQTERQTGRQAGKQAGRQTSKKKPQITWRQADRHLKNTQNNVEAGRQTSPNETCPDYHTVQYPRHLTACGLVDTFTLESKTYSCSDLEFKPCTFQSTLHFGKYHASHDFSLLLYYHHRHSRL